MRMKLLAGIAVLALAACGPTAKAPSGDTGVTALPTTNWPAFRDSFIEGWFKIDPANAVYQGRHDFDGGLGDWSPDGLKRHANFLHEAVAKAKAFDTSK